MRRLSDLYRGSHVRARLLNGVQDEQVGLIAGTENPAAARVLTGADGRYCCTPDAGLANGASVALDDSIDWRDHVVRGDFIRLTSAAQRLHDTDAWQMNDPTLALAVRRFTNGRLGAGTATPTVLSSTSPTVIVDELASTAQRVFLYADPDDGTLRLYNASGAILHAELFVEGMSEPESLGEGPTPIPTLTDLLYLGQGLASALPTVDPEHALETRGVYYASDEGAFYYWTGSAWFPVGGGGGGAALSDATPAALGSAAAGTGSAASREDHVHPMPTAAQVGAMPASLLTSFDGTSSSGFTASAGAGGGTAAVTGGVFEFNQTGVARHDVSNGYNSAVIYRALNCVADFDVIVRIASMPTNAGSQAWLEISDQATGGTRFALYAARTGGDVISYIASSPSIITTATARFGSYTGQEWLRISVRGVNVSFFTGIGVGGARPTTWTPVGSVSTGSGAAWAYVTMTLVTTGSNGATVLQLDDLGIVDRGGGL